jgi:hypothetical protein
MLYTFFGCRVSDRRKAENDPRELDNRGRRRNAKHLTIVDLLEHDVGRLSLGVGRNNAKRRNADIDAPTEGPVVGHGG